MGQGLLAGTALGKVIRYVLRVFMCRNQVVSNECPLPRTGKSNAEAMLQARQYISRKIPIRMRSSEKHGKTLNMYGSIYRGAKTHYRAM